MDRSVSQQLVHSIVEFLRSEMSSGGSVLGAESAESVEVAIQCLETAYHLPPPPPTTNINLYNVYREALAASQTSTSSSSTQQQSSSRDNSVSDEDKLLAEQLKTDGNNKMREEKYSESVDCYTKALEKDQTNAVYHCNRAAAYSKLQNQQAAIEDCKNALKLEPQYSKAYGRMGLAYSSLEQHKEAAECYKKALELEPDNEGYAGNLVVAEEKLAAQPQQQPAAPANPFAALLSGGGGLAGLASAFSSSGSPDLAGLLQNPALMNMATQLMADPNMQNMMTNILNTGVASSVSATTTPATTAAATTTTTVPPAPATAPPPPSTTTSSDAPPIIPQPEGFPGINDLLTAGRQLAEQMQNQHPELLQQLRSQMGGSGGQQPPQQPPPPQP